MGALAQGAALEGASITSRWWEQLIDRLESRTPETFERAIAEWAEQVIGEDDEFADWHYRTGLSAYMAGQLMVRAIEVEDDAGAEGTLDPVRERLGLRQEGESFLDLTFDDQVDWFRAKRVVEVEEFEAIDDKFKQAAFSSRVVLDNNMRERAQRAISRALEGELRWDMVITQMRADEISLGLTPEKSHVLDNIARTNVATSYGAAKWDAMGDPDIADLLPYYEYLTAGDTRVRDTHRPLHGRVFRTQSPVGKLYFAPIGWRCRCAAKSMSERKREQTGKPITTQQVFGARPDKGWENEPQPLGAINDI